MIPTTFDEVVAYYRDQLQARERDVQQDAQRWIRIGVVRGILLLISLMLLGLGIAAAYGYGWLWYGLFGFVFAAFVGFAIHHENLQSRMNRDRLLIGMHRESLARCHRRWSEIRVPEIEVPAEFAPTSKDLDLLGPNSIFTLLGVTRTPLGTATLTSWIIEGALDDEIIARQEAVQELKSEFEWRLNFRLQCEQLAASQSGPSQFIQWCESPSWFRGNRWVLWLARLTTVGSMVAIFGAITTLLPLTIAGPMLIVTCLINFGLSVFKAGSIHDVFNQVSSRSNDAGHYVRLFDMVAQHEARSDRMKKLRQQFERTGDGAQSQMQSLGWLVWLANIRREGMLFLIYLVFEFLFFWDAHALDWLERWKVRHGRGARAWFAALGEVEALAALAKLAGDQPDWVFPTVSSVDDSQQAVIRATQLGHPLLDESRVANDVEVGPPGKVLLVTGSNMSGKSTLLRSLGANIVLAQMGSVVCAQSLTLPPVRIETSMRIADSLADGVSFFMAELKRLKDIVDIARNHSRNQPRRLLFLLDEILQGTNSRERQIAVTRVVRKLIDEHAIGAISTHDLDLAKSGPLVDACQPVHFSEQFVERDGVEVMTFDYQMKPGVSQTTNALKLLELVGLEDSETAGATPPADS